jgi:hypothetical protein
MAMQQEFCQVMFVAHLVSPDAVEFLDSLLRYEHQVCTCVLYCKFNRMHAVVIAASCV